MSKYFLPWGTAMLCVAVALFGWGCDGDDDDDTTTVVVTNAPPAGDEEPGLQTLESGNVGVPIGGIPVDAASVTVPDDGNLIGVVSWSEAVALSARFVKGADPTGLGEVTGASPLTSTVLGVAKDEVYTLRLVNMDVAPAVAAFTITFEPE